MAVNNIQSEKKLFIYWSEGLAVGPSSPEGWKISQLWSCDISNHKSVSCGHNWLIFHHSGELHPRSGWAPDQPSTPAKSASPNRIRRTSTVAPTHAIVEIPVSRTPRWLCRWSTRTIGLLGMLAPIFITYCGKGHLFGERHEYFFGELACLLTRTRSCSLW